MKLEIIKENDNITIKDIEDIENKYNVFFPNDYKDFLLENNGGIPQELMVFKSINDRIKPFIMFALHSLKELKEILQFVKDDTEGFLASSKDDFNPYYQYYQNKMVEIGETAINFFIYICYSEENAGKIYCADLIHDDEFILLANSFDEFINNFEPVTEEELESGVFRFQN